jgi:hypothetical protein
MPIFERPTVDEFWRALAPHLHPFSAEEQRAAVALYRELAKGQAVEHSSAKPSAFRRPKGAPFCNATRSNARSIPMATIRKNLRGPVTGSIVGRLNVRVARLFWDGKRGPAGGQRDWHVL